MDFTCRESPWAKGPAAGGISPGIHAGVGDPPSTTIWAVYGPCPASAAKSLVNEAREIL